jgi:preprotein translocase subunit SecG
MVTFLTIVHIFVCLFLILTVLLQAGKGGGMGVALGGGGSQTVFGSSGAGNFLTRLTSVTAAVFMMTSLGLAHYSSQQDSKRLQRLETEKSEQKKHDDERLAQMKADLEKTRTAAAPNAGLGGAAVPAAAESTSTAATTEKSALAEMPVVAKAAEKPAEKPAATEKAATTGKPSAVEKPAAISPKPKAKAKEVSTEGAAEEAKSGTDSADKPAEEAPKPKLRVKKAAKPASVETPAGEAAPAEAPSPAKTGETPAAP